MTERDFFYWLQGFFELTESNDLTPKQVRMIKDHMALVATKVTPKYGDTFANPRSSNADIVNLQTPISC